VPRDVRRRFARVAGLLELADAEFASIRKQLAEYAEAVDTDIRENPAQLELDLVSLRALFKFNSNSKRLDPLVAKLMQKKIVGTSDDIDESYVGRFAMLGIGRVDQLEAVASKEREAVSKFARYWVALPQEDDEINTDDDGTIGRGIGLFYLLYVLLRRTGSRALIQAYLEQYHIGIHSDKGKIVDELMNFAPDS